MRPKIGLRYRIKPRLLSSLKNAGALVTSKGSVLASRPVTTSEKCTSQDGHQWTTNRGLYEANRPMVLVETFCPLATSPKRSQVMPQQNWTPAKAMKSRPSASNTATTSAATSGVRRILQPRYKTIAYDRSGGS